MKKVILTSMLMSAGLLVTACEAEREEAYEEQEGIGGAGLREEPGEEGLMEAEPREQEGILENEQQEGVLENEQREGVLEND